MKKAFDQTIRDIKREVNKKVLKVPSVEQKVLDATSNEPWGPHGSLLADIAQATRNYHEYQIIMAVIWKRINDTGKNWRHVYKALTVLEYMVAHGSERIIDEIREHAYQISTLSDFQYIDSSGRDQGNNVRRKSQSLVLLVNDKERIQEVRQKAASNRDKFRTTSGAGGMYRPGSYSGDERFGDDRNGYGFRDDERYSRYGDSYSRDGRDSEEHYGRGSYRDDDSRGRSRSVDGDRYGSRSRSSDREGDRAYDDDDRHSRGSSVKAEEQPQDGRPLERKFSEQNLSAPPSYEDAVGDSRSPTLSERNGEQTATSVPQSSSPVVNFAPQSSSPATNGAPQSSSPTGNINANEVAGQQGPSSLPNTEADPFDEFDPRGSFSAAAPSVAPTTSDNAQMDLFGSLSEVFAPNPLAITAVSTDATNAAPNPTFPEAAPESNVLNQGFEDPFGDSPFRAIPSGEAAAHHNFAPMSTVQPASHTHTNFAPQKVESTNLEFADAFSGLHVEPNALSSVQSAPNSQFLPQGPQSLQEDDVLAGILPPSGPLPPSVSQPNFHPSTGFPPATSQTPFSDGPQATYYTSGGQLPTASSYMPQSGLAATPFQHMPGQNFSASSAHLSHQNSTPYSVPPSVTNPNQGGSLSRQGSDFLGDVHPQAGSAVLASSQSTPSSAADALALVPLKPAKEKFELKSAVWTDTLNRGLVNLDISGPKINPNADIGIDFQSLNRKEKRMEKPSATPVTSNVAMGKAMGSGSGIGRAGASAFRPPVNPMMGPGMGMGMGAGMGMGGGPGGGMGMGGYGMNQQPMGMGMGGMGMGMNPGMGMNMGMGPGQGVPMQPGSNMNNYNPMMGRGGYPQQPYGGAYR